ncbi:MAG: 50S ribosomal protein L19e [Theionarchaea archaeon]|nr:50S ribosomal protein L19e [Theionarchaea archaeon]MBU7001768.1 50S ribosomal protein L19e [Theionarchaea archaeon]MBU7022283.1 50S ribosomal protein L19e [Theionarchaea archaeon]MBU7035517.1 50S ribosomal protein L19e [Theionarchaea archaeon]MBU7041136.1 50S ribosomal protein L19e [Theionarchaea archaeon]
MNLSVQKRIASDVMDCGVHRVWLDRERAEEISMAITREDIRKLVHRGLIKKKPEKAISHVRARKRTLQRKKGRRKGYGTRKGTANARSSRKGRWMQRIRSQRRELKTMRDTRYIERDVYRRLYRMAKGGAFRSVTHLRTYIDEHSLVRKRR